MDYYIKEIILLAEQGVLIWNSGLTKAQMSDLEKIQKVALLIILCEDYSNFDMACTVFGIATISSRRAQLCTHFAVKLLKSSRSDK